MTGNRTRTALRSACLLFLFMWAAQEVFGASITVTVSVSAEQVSLNERLELTISITGPDARKASSPALKPMPGFTIMGTSTSTEFQFINGKSSTLVSYIYTLMPRDTGSFDVGGATVTVGNQDFATDPKRVTVSAGSAPQAKTVPDAGRVSGGSGDNDIFIRATVDNREPFAGEQVTLTFELYSRLTLLGDTEYSPPSTTGFWTVELPKITPSTQVANNRMYKYNAVKTALFPTTAGNLTIGPASLTFTTGGFFTPQQTKTLSTKPITIKVKQLPEEGKPPGFTGVVGDFRITASADKAELKTGEVVTVTVTISGEGNLDMVTSVNPPDFSAFRTYDPKIATKLQNSGFIVGGAKVWEYVLMPKTPGTITVRPFSISFFNPRTKKYKTVETNPVTFRITPGERNVADGGDISDGRNSIEAIASDISFIKPDKRALVSADSQLYLNPLFYLFYILPILIFAGAIVLKRKHDAIERNSGLKRGLNAWKRAQRCLELAAQAEGREEIAAFCGRLSEAVVGFVGDRLNIDTGALTALVLEERLRGAGVSRELAERVRKTLEMCDFVRFSSSGAEHGLRDRLLSDVREILSQLREVI